jgi:hypothetical protein
MSNAMDPLHITEFASPRYFDKLKSLDDTAENADTTTLPEAGPTLSEAAPTITLPIGNPRPLKSRRRMCDDSVRPNDQKRRLLGHDLSHPRAQRKSNPIFANLRSKISVRQKGLGPLTEQNEYIDEEKQPMQQE